MVQRDRTVHRRDRLLKLVVQERTFWDTLAEPTVFHLLAGCVVMCLITRIMFRCGCLASETYAFPVIGTVIHLDDEDVEGDGAVHRDRHYRQEAGAQAPASSPSPPPLASRTLFLTERLLRRWLGSYPAVKGSALALSYLFGSPESFYELLQVELRDSFYPDGAVCGDCAAACSCRSGSTSLSSSLVGVPQSSVTAGALAATPSLEGPAQSGRTESSTASDVSEEVGSAEGMLVLGGVPLQFSLKHERPLLTSEDGTWIPVAVEDEERDTYDYRMDVVCSTVSWSTRYRAPPRY